MDNFDDDIKRDFLEESLDLLHEIETAFLRLEIERHDSDLLNEIFRHAHNLKGASSAVGFTQLSELTHIAENVILKLKAGDIEPSDDVVTVLLEFKDTVTEMIQGLNEDLTRTFNIQGVLERLNCKLSVVESVDEVPHAPPSTSAGFVDMEEWDDSEISGPQPKAAEEVSESFKAQPDNNQSVSSGGVNDESEVPVSEALIESMREAGFDEQTIREISGDSPLRNVATSQSANDSVAPQSSKPSPLETKSAPLQPQQSVPDATVQKIDEIALAQQQINAENSKSVNRSDDETVRVKLSRIDKLNDLIGELVILQTVLGQRRFTAIEDELTNKSIGQMGKLFKEAQEISMSLRMLPLRSTFQKMTRIVRDTSKTLGKKVKLELQGEQTEVDKTVVELISDPLVHIIRNAVDHGLEPTEHRTQLGKDPVGHVELKAFHEGSNLIVEITDDGKGIDPNALFQKAVGKGLFAENTVMSEQEKLNLIFHPGFSTKDEVTEVSGRGVGMDVVKNNIEQMGGEVFVKSHVGKGSTFRIVLPLTLAIIDGIVLSSNQQKFVVPLNQIHELTQVPNEQVQEFSGGIRLFKLRGEVLPLFYLNHKLGTQAAEADSYIVIIIRGLSYDFGVVVDDVVNQQQIVIKSLGEDIRGRKGFMGSAIMADGMPAFIIDLFELFKSDLKKSRGYQNLLKEREQISA